MSDFKKHAMAGVMLAVAFFVAAADAQTKKPRRSAPSTSTAKVAAISDRDWGILSGTFDREEWQTAVRLSGEHIDRLEKENDKKQLAQLRYLHVLALAGRTNSYITGKNEPAAADSWLDLEAAVRRFKGTELVAPARKFEANCAGKVNFVCPVRGDSRSLRVTATNKNGDSILLFEYFLFDDELNAASFKDKRLFLSGSLERAEYNEDTAKPWIVRLFFRNSAAALSTDR